MGSGYFDSVSYSARAAARTATGKSLFTHSAAAASGAAPAIHPSMDIRLKRNREARDNADNPVSFPIAVVFDVTGSMRDIPNYLQKELGRLMGFVLNEGVVTNPQILFGAVGDAYCDDAPLQIGEFEADDALVEKCLSQIFLEGGGGGSHEESYELALRFFARNVQTDAWEKRGTKGLLFLIGDENYYKTIPAHVAEHWFGDAGQDLDTALLAKELQERWEVFLLRPGGTYHFEDRGIEQAWREILPPQHVIRVPEREQIVPTIAMTISAMAGHALKTSADALKKHGFDAKLVDAAIGALVPLESVAPASLASVAPGSLTTAPKAARL